MKIKPAKNFSFSSVKVWNRLSSRISEGRALDFDGAPPPPLFPRIPSPRGALP